jgi:hypothetical protein
MNTDNARLSRAGAGFGLAASITILFSTALAAAKDAHKPLNDFMNALAGHNLDNPRSGRPRSRYRTGAHLFKNQLG